MSKQPADTPLPADIEKLLKKHLEAPDALLKHLSEVMIRWFEQEEFILFDGPKDTEILADISLALRALDARRLAQLSYGAQKLLGEQLSANILNAKTIEKPSQDGDAPGLKERLAEFARTAEDLQTHVDAVTREIEKSARTKRSIALLKRDRLHLVDIAAQYWEHWGPGGVPKAEIKDHQPFARFLGDLADLFNVETIASKAQHSWLKQNGAVPPLKRN